MYRLLADIFNDAAMVLECFSPVLPRPLRVGLLSAASVLRALCGVAAGSAKASLSGHFARGGNLGEVNAVSVLCGIREREGGKGWGWFEGGMADGLVEGFESGDGDFVDGNVGE